MTAFHRLALLAGTTGYGVAILLVARFLGWPSAALAAAIGLLLALVATLELAPSSRVEKSEAPEDEERRGDNYFSIRRRDRRDIERSAQRAADEG